MDESLRSILCEPESWTWEPFLNYYIKFNKDETGEVRAKLPLEVHFNVELTRYTQLFCIQELTYLCALNFSWKTLQPPPPPQAKTRSKAQVLGTLRLEITLQKGLAKGLQSSDPETCLRMHDGYLLPTAYRPKSFTATLEKGNFLPASRTGHDAKAVMQQYGLRLLFDRSPYPAYEDWNTAFPNDVPPVGPVDREQAPMVEFVARELPRESFSGTAAMNNQTSAKAWGSCTVS